MMRQIESENISQIINGKSNGCSRSQTKSEKWDKLNNKF